METVITVGTAIASLGLILLGLKDDLSKKKSQLLFVLSSYVFLLGTIFFNVSNFVLYLILVIIFLFGGLGYMAQEKNDLEKELNLYVLLLYSALVIFFLTFQIGNLFYVIVISINRSVFSFMDTNMELIFGLTMLVTQYTIVAKDTFNLNFFNETIEEAWKPNLGRQIKNQTTDNSENENTDQYIENLAFVVFVEDKNFFDRTTTFVTPLEMLRKIIKKRKVFFKRILNFVKRLICNEKKNTANRIVKRIKPYIRGYSTIEQQFIRQYAMTKYSYHYLFRRKILIELIYTYLLMSAIKRRKSRTFSRKYFERKKIRNKMTSPLKLSILKSYYKEVLDSPLDIDGLKKKLVSISALNSEEIDSKFEKFNDSEIKKQIISCIKEATNSNLSTF
ncbi:hypothetical protein P7D43_22580 [Enterococcus avium]|uniref:Uncharacterized protein n=2 Tax=Enterococcus avium TaxID=33945 RepID=A0AAW8S366_ENTAV|nr:hypothetical protein [Enterococcus avium]MDT2405152.1 hypothetical protein [Enterococcus avium]